MSDEQDSIDPTNEAWMFLLAEHNRPLSGYGARLQRELSRVLGAREIYPTVHLTIQKFNPMSPKTARAFWERVVAATASLSPFEAIAERAFALYSDFRSHHIAKLVISYDDPARQFIASIPGLLRAFGTEPLYDQPSQLVTFLGDLEHEQATIPDTLVQHRPVFTVDSIAFSRYTPGAGFEVTDRCFLNSK